MAIILLGLKSAPLGAAVFELDSGAAKIADEIADHILQRRYEQAMERALHLSFFHSGAGSFFVNMVRLSRFDDLGDTAVVWEARSTLETSRFAREDEWEALRLFQLGYVNAILGNRFASALHTRSAALRFARMPGREAAGFYALYVFYMEGLVAWIPGKRDRRSEWLGRVRRAAEESRWFWPLFATAAVWMHYDLREYEQGLRMSEWMLMRVPGHPVFTQIRADMLFRLGRLSEAAELYEMSAWEYARRAPNSVRYWCAVINLARIYRESGDRARQAQWQSLLRDSRFKALRSWLPPSLLRVLEEMD